MESVVWCGRATEGRIQPHGADQIGIYTPAPARLGGGTGGSEPALPRLESPPFDVVLGLHAQPVCNPGDVVEIPDDLCRIVDRSVIEPVAPQLINVSLAGRFLIVRELLGVAAKRLIDCTQVGTPPVLGDGVDERIALGIRIEDILDLFPEVMRMRLSSVEAVVRLRGDHRKHLPLPSREW